MRNVVVVLLLTALGWYGYGKYQDKLSAQRAAAAELTSPSSKRVGQPLAPNTVSFTCDGRTYCSQMTSCAEATFFLKNCQFLAAPVACALIAGTAHAQAGKLNVNSATA